MPTIHDVEQRSDEWHRLRAPNINGTDASVIVGNGRKGSATEPVGRRDLRTNLALTRLGMSPPIIHTHTTSAMQMGITNEPIARHGWEMASGLRADLVGYCTSDSIPYIGCSPDAFIGDDGVLEIKCPKASIHWSYIELAQSHGFRGFNAVPALYQPQILHTLIVTERDYLEFLSFSDAFPYELAIHRIRVYRCELENELAVYREALGAFIGTVAVMASAMLEELKVTKDRMCLAKR